MSTFKYSSQAKLPQETCKQHTRTSLLDTLQARQVVASQRFILNAQQHPPLMDVTPSPKFHECEYSLRSRNPRLVLGRTNRLNDFVTVKYLLIVCKSNSTEINRYSRATQTIKEFHITHLCPLRWHS